MSIYTRRGDRGATRIYGSKSRISKTDRRVVALGAIDELNAQLGVASSFLATGNELKERIKGIQRDLFAINSELATAVGFKFRKNSTTRLEKVIDFYWKKMPPLANFIFPGGTPAGAQFQVCRTVCRRAERAVLRFTEAEKTNPNILSYVNRLSDVMHTFSRWANFEAGIPDDIWRAK
ncbi:cob(I)yrinic acid a,c-diamide adenosyltransferase [Candidatus Microgenomates bacterium]|nr:cob(I)yrinic acid a,c-diamide adenosyltransferase [Candidatus Microgenomates bacterium]